MADERDGKRVDGAGRAEAELARLRAENARLAEELAEARRSPGPVDVEALREGEERLRLALEAAGLGTWDLDLVNDVAVRSLRHDQIWGYTEPQPEWGLEIAMRHVVPEDRPSILEAYERGIGNGTLSHENRVIWPDGSVHWIHAYGRFRYDSEGRPVRVVGVVGDVTERKRAEEALQAASERFQEQADDLSASNEQLHAQAEELAASNEELQAQAEELRCTIGELAEAQQSLARERELLQGVFDNIPVLLVMWDPRLQRFTLNRHAEKVLGWTTADANTGDFMSKVYPDAAYRAEVSAYMQSLQPGWHEWSSTTKDGERVPADWANIRLSDDTSIGIGVDLRERKRAEEALRASEERIRTILESTTDGYLAIDRDWRYTYFNEQGARMIGMRREDLIGGRVWDLFPHAMETRFGTEYHRVMATGQPSHFEEYYPDPLNMWLETHVYRTDEGLAVYFRDITERKRVEEALRSSEARLRRFYESGLLGVIYWNMNGEITDANDKFLEMVGYTREELVAGRIDWAQMTPPEYRQRDEDSMAELKATGANAAPFEKEYIHKDGRRVPILIAGAMLDEERFDGVAFVLDITERKRAEEALRLSEARLRLALDAARMIAWDYDPSTKQVTMTQNAAEVLALPGGRVHEDSDQGYAIIHPEDVENHRALVNEAIENGGSFVSVYRQVADGKVAWLEERGRAVTDESGRTVRLVGVTQNITERKRSEEALMEANERLQAQSEELSANNEQLQAQAEELRCTIGELQEAQEAIRRSEARWTAAIETFDIGAIIATEDEQVIYWNPAARKMHGFTYEGEGIEPLERTPVTFQLWTPDRSHLLELDEWPMRRIKRGEPVRNLELWLRRPDQGWGKYVSYSGNMVETPSGEHLIFLSVYDLTEQQRAEEALREADRRKNDYISMLSHELRNPLAAISSGVELIALRTQGDPLLKRAAEAAGRQVGNMARMLDDLLDVARMTRGQISLHRERLDLVPVVQSAMETVAPKIEAHRHQLSLSLPPEPLAVEGDPVRLSQIVVNLLDNAAKYTPDGGRIWVEVRRVEAPTPPHPHTPTPPYAEVRIGDTGKGIPQDLLPHMFEAFERGEHAVGSAEGGLGLGLALVRHLVERHGGQVEARSEGPGKGSEFIVRLPLLPTPAAAAAGSAGAKVQTGRRILLVEDSEDVAELLAMTLEMEGHEIAVAHDGPAALETAGRFRPDVALIDVGLPGMDGYEVARRMRRDPALAGALLVALTGFGRDEDRERSREAGISHHLVKPVEMDELRRVLAAVPGGAS